MYTTFLFAFNNFHNSVICFYNINSYKPVPQTATKSVKVPYLPGLHWACWVNRFLLFVQLVLCHAPVHVCGNPPKTATKYHTFQTSSGGMGFLCYSWYYAETSMACVLRTCMFLVHLSIFCFVSHPLRKAKLVVSGNKCIQNHGISAGFNVGTNVGFKLFVHIVHVYFHCNHVTELSPLTLYFNKNYSHCFLFFSKIF